MILATESDVENFIYERSPHIKSIEMETIDYVCYVKIKLPFWYRFWYEKTYYKFITEQLEENQVFGMSFDVALSS